eukprot:8558632-Prorocentrum_lima.AAC.1
MAGKCSNRAGAPTSAAPAASAEDEAPPGCGRGRGGIGPSCGSRCSKTTLGVMRTSFHLLR